MQSPRKTSTPTYIYIYIRFDGYKYYNRRFKHFFFVSQFAASSSRIIQDGGETRYSKNTRSIDTSTDCCIANLNLQIAK